jgi:hypothetical protein
MKPSGRLTTTLQMEYTVAHYVHANPPCPKCSKGSLWLTLSERIEPPEVLRVCDCCSHEMTFIVC